MELFSKTNAGNLKALSKSKSFENIDVKSILFDIGWNLEDMDIEDMDVCDNMLKIKFVNGQIFTVTVA